MTIDHQTVAKKLRQARELQSFLVEAVSEETGIPTGRLEQFESEESVLSGDEVQIFANFHRHGFRYFWTKPVRLQREQTDILYRRHGDIFTFEDHRASQDFLGMSLFEILRKKGYAGLYFCHRGTTTLNGDGNRLNNWQWPRCKNSGHAHFAKHPLSSGQ